MPFWDKFSKKKSREELYLAARSGDIYTAQKLLKSGIHPDKYRRKEWFNGTALMVAASNGHLGVVETLISSGADVNIRSCSGYTALAWAAQEGHTKVVDLLLKANSDIESKDIYGGSTPLHRSCESGHVDTVLLLLSRGADRSVKTTDKGTTPIIEASRQGHTAVVQTLLEHGSSVNVTDYKGFTPLHHAVLNRSDDTVRLLLQHGANVKAQTSRNSMAIHLAAQDGYLSTTKILLEEGGALCTLNVKGHNGLTPAERARANGHWELAHYLEQVQNRKIKVTGEPIVTQPPVQWTQAALGAGEGDVDEMTFWMEALGVGSSAKAITSYNYQHSKTTREEDTCKICMDATIDCVLLECGHIVSCLQCGKQLSRCPVCRGRVLKVVHTYKA